MLEYVGRGGAAARRHHARPPGRGRRQVAARRLCRLGSQDLPRLQPQRRAAHRDRHRARPAIGGGRGRVLQPAARDPRLARRQRRQHGRGQPALRRERVGAAGGHRRRSAPRPRSRTSTRSAFCRRRSSSRSNGRSSCSSAGGRVVQETRLWDADAGRHGVDAQQGRSARLSLFSRAGSAAARRQRRRAIDAIRAAMPELPEARRRRFVDGYGLARVRRRAADADSRGLPTTSRRTVRAGAAPKAREQLDDGRAGARAEGRRPPRSGAVAGRAGAARRARWRSSRRARSAARSPRTCSRRCSRRAAPPTRSSSAKGSRRSTTRRRSRTLIAAVLAANADAVAQYRAGKASTFGFLVGQVMKATAGKANPKRVNELLKRALDA